MPAQWHTLYLRFTACWIVNTVKGKLNKWHKRQPAGDNKNRKHAENNTTHGTNMAGVAIGVKKCSEPGRRIRNIQSILLMTPEPLLKENL